MGVDHDGKPKDGFTRGMELRGKYTLFAEGARGSLTKELIRKFDLSQGREPQKFGIGLKELWQVAPEKHKPGLVQHSFGWPLDNGTGGGSVPLSFRRRLGVSSASSSTSIIPIRLCRRSTNSSASRRIPRSRATFEGGKRLAYGARAITEGGYQSVPKLIFPGGALIGCAAGFVNVPRIKGRTMRSFPACWRPNMSAPRSPRAAPTMNSSPMRMPGAAPRSAAIWSRSAMPSRSGRNSARWPAIALGGLDMWTNELFGFSLFGTLKHGKPDYATLKPLSEVKPIQYPQARRQDHLRQAFFGLRLQHQSRRRPAGASALEDPTIPVRATCRNMASRRGSIARPASMRSSTAMKEEADPRFVINAQNCVHCKTCDIKDPAQNINWVPPEGGGGPNYPNM